MSHSDKMLQAIKDGARRAGSMSEVIRLAELGDAEMQFVLAASYLLDNNVSAGVPWLRKAANQGHALAKDCMTRV